MLISISDSVSHEVSETEALAAEGHSGDLNMEDLHSLISDVTSKKTETETRSVFQCSSQQLVLTLSE